MMQAIIDKGITAESVGVMKDLMQMHREVQADAAKREFAVAFANVQAECRPIIATKEIPSKDGTIRSRFAPLGEIREQTDPIIQRNGFSMSFSQSKVEGGLTRVECILIHRGGHETRSGFTCREQASPGNTAAQNDVGTNSLASRLALCNLLGLRFNYDADARAEGDTITPDEAADLKRRVSIVVAGDALRIERFLGMCGAREFGEIRRAKYDAALPTLVKLELSSPKGKQSQSDFAAEVGGMMDRK